MVKLPGASPLKKKKRKPVSLHLRSHQLSVVHQELMVLQRHPLPNTTLKCWLAWPCGGLEQVATAVGSLCRKPFSHVQMTMVFCPLPHPLAFNSLPTHLQDVPLALAGRGCICLTFG